MNEMDFDQFLHLTDAYVDKTALLVLQNSNTPTELRAAIIAFNDGLCEMVRQVHTEKSDTQLTDIMRSLIFDIALRVHQRCLELIHTTVTAERSKARK